MKALRSDLIKLFEQLGWATASKWSPSKMRLKILELVVMAKDEEGNIPELKDEDSIALLGDMMKADGDVEIVSKASDLDELTTEPESDVDDGVAEAVEVQEELGEVEPDDSVVEEEPVVEEKEEGLEANDSVIEEKPKFFVGEEKEEGVKPSKKKKGKKPKVSKEKKNGRPKIMGKYSVGPFVRWLGIQGVGLDGAKSILESEGIVHLKEISIKMELKERREKHDPANVSQEDQDNFKEKYTRFFGEGNV